MTNPDHDRLAARLAHDAETALPEPSAGLDNNIREALAGASSSTRSRPSVRRIGPGSLALVGAAALLIAGLQLGDSPAEERLAAPTYALPLSIHLQAPAQEPLAALGAVLGQPLLAEWRNLARDAIGTADYLLAHVQRPLRGLRALASTGLGQPGVAGTTRDG